MDKTTDTPGDELRTVCYHPASVASAHGFHGVLLGLGYDVPKATQEFSSAERIAFFFTPCVYEHAHDHTGKRRAIITTRLKEEKYLDKVCCYTDGWDEALALLRGDKKLPH